MLPERVANSKHLEKLRHGDWQGLAHGERSSREAVYKQEPYSFEKWRAQRTWKRYVGLFDCFNLLRVSFWPVIVVTLASTAIVLYRQIAVERHGWAWFKGGNSSGEYSVPFQLISFALSLLLVFRTTEVYRRWWDARRSAGRLCTCMRHVVRMGVCWFGDDACGKRDLRALAHWTQILPFMMLFHVCEGHDMQAIMQNLIPRHEMDFLKRTKRPSFLVATTITHIITSADLIDLREQAMLLQLTAAMKEFGNADDILKQPLPVAYTRHTSRFMLAWLMGLPVAVWETYTWFTIPISASIAFFLLGIEYIGVQLEEPFSVLPLDRLARECQDDITELITSMQACKDIVETSLHTQIPQVFPKGA